MFKLSSFSSTNSQFIYKYYFHRQTIYIFRHFFEKILQIISLFSNKSFKKS